MASECCVACDGAKLSVATSQRNALILNAWGPDPNVNLKIEDIDRRLVYNIPDRLRDLLYIATYVYCADQGFARGGKTDPKDGREYHRKFRFALPVRDVEFWSNATTLEILQRTLRFLSDDDYEFEFQRVVNGPPIEELFDFGVGGMSGFEAESVALFSGGVDSLGGAINETQLLQHKTVLATHRSTPKNDARQRKLADLLRSLGAPPGSTLHVPVWVNKSSKISADYTQRTRSFLYASIGAVIARVFEIDGIHFYENGITSMNLPISEQFYGARASRTTHPLALKFLSELMSHIFEKPFFIQNPFLWKTKREIVELIGDAGSAKLLKDAISCSRTMERSNQHLHCGRCFQCIGRRFAMLASKYGSHDPAENYEVDLLVGAREKGEDITMVESFARSAKEIAAMSDDGFFQRFGEASRIIGHLEGASDENASRLLELHRRHADDVDRVLVEGIRAYAKELKDDKLPRSCLLVLALPKHYVVSDKKHARNENIFQNMGNGEWLLGFKGKKKRILDSLGIRYMAYLLENHGVSIAAEDLYFYVNSSGPIMPSFNRATELSVSGVSRGENVMNERAFRELNKRREKLKDELEIAKDTQDETRQSEILEELEALEEQRKSAKGFRGKSRRIGDDAEKIRKSVSKAISEAQKKVQKKGLLALAEHLTLNVHKGGHFVYGPVHPPIHWRF